MDGDVEKCDVSSGYGSMNSHNDLQQNGFESSMNYNQSNDTYTNATFKNGYVSSGIGLLKIHTLPQDKQSGNFNDMNMNIENVDVNGDYCYMNIYTVSESNNHNSIDYTKKKDEISTNIYFMENNGLPDGVGIDVMLPASTLKKLQD